EFEVVLQFGHAYSSMESLNDPAGIRTARKLQFGHAYSSMEKRSGIARRVAFNGFNSAILIQAWKSLRERAKYGVDGASIRPCLFKHGKR
ncbi:MAG: hypothetical protein N2112_17300, partial [Gemmataceae bacterium]|nr:hypothetical protein [Gemmataceae bacterium]